MHRDTKDLIKMNGESVKYLYYEENKRSILTIPVSMARGLNWDHKDDIGIIVKTIDGQEGLFLWKREKIK